MMTRTEKKKKFFFSEGPPAVPLKSYTMLYNKMWRGEKISTSLGEGKICVCVSDEFSFDVIEILEN